MSTWAENDMSPTTRELKKIVFATTTSTTTNTTVYNHDAAPLLLLILLSTDTTTNKTLGVYMTELVALFGTDFWHQGSNLGSTVSK